MRAHEFTEGQFGTNPKRPARQGSRPPRGHEEQQRYTVSRGEIDPELSQVKTFAKQHYPGYSSNDAFEKFVQRSLMHAKQDDEAQNARLDKIEAQLAKAQPTPQRESLEEHKKGVKAVKYSKKPKGATSSADAFAKAKEKAAAPKPTHKSPLAKVDKHLGESRPGYPGVSPDTKCSSCGTPYGKHFRFDAEGNIESTTIRGMCGRPENFKPTAEEVCSECGCVHDQDLEERGKASLKLCKSSTPDAELGASNLASCKSQGLRARDGEKSHKLGKSAKSRVKVGGHKIKGKKYGGPLPDWS